MRDGREPEESWDAPDDPARLGLPNPSGRKGVWAVVILTVVLLASCAVCVIALLAISSACPDTGCLPTP